MKDNLNIFIPELTDKSSVDDFILPLIKEAIRDGAFYYPYYITPSQGDKASLIFNYLFLHCVKNKTFAVATDGDRPVGFESYLRSPFCDYFKTPNIYDGLLTFVSKDYRRQGVAGALRKFLRAKANFQSGDIFRFSVQKDNKAGYLSVDKLTKELNMNMVETGVTYEGQLIDTSNIS